MEKNIEEKLGFVDHVANFLAKNFKTIIIVGIVIIVALVGIVTVSVINSNKAEKDFAALSALEVLYKETLVETEKADEFLASADSLIASAKETYPGYKAMYLKALYAFENKEYTDALDLFYAVYELSSDNFLGSVALVNAAAAAENAGDLDKALEYNKKVWDDYSTTSPVSAKALFNTARLYEAKDMELAKGTYQQLADQYKDATQSEYAKLAEARLANL